MWARTTTLAGQRALFIRDDNFIYYIVGFSLVPRRVLWTLFQMYQFAKQTVIRDQPKRELALQSV